MVTSLAGDTVSTISVTYRARTAPALLTLGGRVEVVIDCGSLSKLGDLAHEVVALRLEAREARLQAVELRLQRRLLHVEQRLHVRDLLAEVGDRLLPALDGQGQRTVDRARHLVRQQG